MKKSGDNTSDPDKGKSIEEATRGMQVAVSLNGPQIGRQINKVMFFIPIWIVGKLNYY